MHDIIEHYGKVVVALAGVLAALLLTAAGTVLKKDTERLMSSGIQESLIHSQMCSSVKAEQEHFQTESLIQ